MVMRQKIYLNMRSVIWRSWRETSFIFQRNFLLWLSWKWKLTSGCLNNYVFLSTIISYFFEMFFKPLLFTISRKDLSDIVSEEKFVEIYSFMKISISDKLCISTFQRAIFARGHSFIPLNPKISSLVWMIVYQNS